MLETSSPPQKENSDKPQPQKPVSSASRFFFLNTIFAILLTVLMVVGGVLGYFSMTKQSQPDIDIAVANITTTWLGADPQTIEQQVTDEIETEITSVENIKQIQSASYTGFSIIDVEFYPARVKNCGFAGIRLPLQPETGSLFDVDLII